MWQCNFPGKGKSEEIILLVRKHWFIPAKHVAILGFLLCVPTLLYFAALNVYPDLLNFPWYPFLVLGSALYYFGVCTYGFIVWIDYYSDIWIVTSERLVDIEQDGIFRRSISELNLSKVEDISTDINGVMATIFHYGTITIQTAAESQRFVLEDIPNPEAIRQKIFSVVNDYQQQREQRIGTAATPIPAAPPKAPAQKS